MDKRHFRVKGDLALLRSIRVVPRGSVHFGGERVATSNLVWFTQVNTCHMIAGAQQVHHIDMHRSVSATIVDVNAVQYTIAANVPNNPLQRTLILSPNAFDEAYSTTC